MSLQQDALRLGKHCGQCGAQLGDTIHIVTYITDRQQIEPCPVCEPCGELLRDRDRALYAAQKAWREAGGNYFDPGRPAAPRHNLFYPRADGFRGPVPCEACGRQLLGRGTINTRAGDYGSPRRFCSRRCQRHWRNPPKGPTATTCETCGEGFEGRTDASYCSPACRQKAYRARIARGK